MTNKTKLLSTAQKAAKVRRALEQLEIDERNDRRHNAANRVQEARMLVMASPDTAARLYDLLQTYGTRAEAIAKVRESRS